VTVSALTALLLVNALRGRPQLWLLLVIAGLTTAVDGIQRPALESIVPRARRGMVRHARPGRRDIFLDGGVPSGPSPASWGCCRQANGS
jgi:hypothetical protein